MAGNVVEIEMVAVLDRVVSVDSPVVCDLELVTVGTVLTLDVGNVVVVGPPVPDVVANVVDPGAIPAVVVTVTVETLVVVE